MGQLGTKVETTCIKCGEKMKGKMNLEICLKCGKKKLREKALNELKEVTL